MLRMELNQSEREARDLLEGGFPQVIFYGPPGTGKTRAALNVAASILGLEDAEALSVGDDSPFAFVQFHPSYNYEDFVRGIRVETVNGQVAYQTKNRIFGAMAKCAAKQPNEKHILVIDEINRANVSAVLGELIYGLEYRGKEVQTPYEVGGKTGLVIPENLRIIGTMNTADRTIGQIDYAVRRRFAFVHCPPQFDVIVSGDARRFFSDVDKLFVPEFLSADYDKEDVCIGHSYFLTDGVELANKIVYQVIPILREYLKDGVLLKGAAKEIARIESRARAGKISPTTSPPIFGKNKHVVPGRDEWKKGEWGWSHKISGDSEEQLSLRRMVHSLIWHYAKEQQCSDLKELKDAFPDKIRTGFGVVQAIGSKKVLQCQQRGRIRYFLDKKDHIIFDDKSAAVVCTEWGVRGKDELVKSFIAFKEQVKEYGYQIHEPSTIKQPRKKRAN